MTSYDVRIHQMKSLGKNDSTAYLYVLMCGRDQNKFTLRSAICAHYVHSTVRNEHVTLLD